MVACSSYKYCNNIEESRALSLSNCLLYSVPPKTHNKTQKPHKTYTFLLFNRKSTSFL